MAALEEIADVVRYDLIGHGSTPPLNRPLHIDDFVRQTRREMAMAKMESAIVIGVGLGGLIGEALAINYPAQVEALALLSTPYKRTDTQTNKLLDTIMASEIDPLDEEAAGNDLTPYVLPYRIFATHDAHFAEEMKTIDCPVMVATGSLDNDSRPASTRKLGRAMGADIHILDGEGPLSDVSDTDALTTILLEFINAQ